MRQQQAGWRFDNSYARLPDSVYTKVSPLPVADPRVVIVNYPLASTLGLSFDGYSPQELAQLFAGNVLPDGAEPLAQAYAGHQFGHFTILGDGRAHLLGEHSTPDGRRVDIQLKGSGRTPYSRGGDGRAALAPMLREYIISEAMHALGIPTTRSLAVVTTGEPVYRETVQQGAILTRVAASHLRVGTFEYLAAHNEVDLLKQLAEYAIDRHYPSLQYTDQPYFGLVKAVMSKHIALVVEWLRVGFIHGVMNTDNMSLSGETIDYGPCAFMDNYHPDTVFSAIDHTGRYAYTKQPYIVQWNLARFIEALLPLLQHERDDAVSAAQALIQSFRSVFEQQWLAMMRRKLGLFGERQDDATLISDLLNWMQTHNVDYTNTFADLVADDVLERKQYQDTTFVHWWHRWQQRRQQNNNAVATSELMRANNPVRIPRNHLVEAALTAAQTHGDVTKMQMLLAALAEPYSDQPQYADYTQPPTPEQRVQQTFCGT